MKKLLLPVAVCAALCMAPSCADHHAVVPPETTAETVTEEERNVTTETQTTEMPSIRTLPGMIMSDVYVQLWDGSIAPGLRADDAETVKQIIAQQTWGASFDNLSDVRIEAEGVRYAYDTSSGILTAADDRAAILDSTQRETLNAVLAAYLSDEIVIAGAARRSPASLGIGTKKIHRDKRKRGILGAWHRIRCHLV